MKLSLRRTLVLHHFFEQEIQKFFLPVIVMQKNKNHLEPSFSILNHL